MPRGRDKTQAKTFEVVKRVLQSMDFQLAAVAGARINLADRKTAAEAPARRPVESGGKLRQFRIIRFGARLRQRRPDQTLQQQLQHRASALEIMAGIGTVERFVAQRKVRNDIALDRRFQNWPMKP